jgi:UDP:flavonoid glycosyltransferase YjiC (YdhE family)
VIDLRTLSPQAVRDAVREVLHDPSYREKARRIQTEMKSLPGPERAVELLERLSAERKPIIA